MKKSNSIILFSQKQVRRVWDEDKELWYFSVTDVIEVLAENKRPRKYWNDLKKKLSFEGSQLSEKIGQLKMESSDGKEYLTDVADTETLLRLIQSIPSPKAEPFKLWLAKVGYERMEEMEDPELSFDRAMKTYLQKGYSEKWVNQRIKSIEVRKDLVTEWGERGIKENSEYAILTDEITKAWADKSVKDYKKFKGLKKENLRDNMTNIELVLNMLAEASTTEISKKKKPKGLENNKQVARAGGMAAKKARLEIEKQMGESVITARNAKVLQNKQRNFLPAKSKNLFKIFLTTARRMQKLSFDSSFPVFSRNFSIISGTSPTTRTNVQPPTVSARL